jgi:hypothetical protein
MIGFVLTRIAAPVALVALIACADISGAGGTTVGSAASTGTGGSPTMQSVGGAGGSGANGGFGGAGANGGSGGTNPCPNDGPGEPNNTEGSATQLAGVDDDCDGSGKGVSAVLSGGTDADWYFYDQASDSALCNVDPDRDWSQTPGGQLRVCKFIECQNGEVPGFSCPSGTTDAASPSGRPGCCGSLPFEFGVSCVFIGSDLLRVYVRVDEPGAPANNCNGYTLNYAF